MTMIDRNIAWAAGFFEGEGCWTYSSRWGDRGVVRAGLGQKGENGLALLEKFKSIVGVGTIIKRNGKTNNDMYYWSTNKLNEAEIVFNLLKDWLSSRRINRFAELNNKQIQSRLENPPKKRGPKVIL